MRCKFVRHLRAYQDCELPLPQREELRRHLGDCPHCARELDGLQRVERLLSELSPLPPPQHLAPATLQRLRTQPSPTAITYRHAPAWTAMAAAAACLVIGFHIMSGDQSDRSQPVLQAVAPLEMMSPAVAILGATVSPADRAAAARDFYGDPHPTVSRADRGTRRDRDSAPRRIARKTDAKSVAVVTAPSDAEKRALAAMNAIRAQTADDPDLMVAALENVALTYAGTTQATQALLTVGDLQRQRGNFAEADASYRRLLALQSKPRLPRALAHQALADLRSEAVGDDEVARYHRQEAARALRTETGSGASKRQAVMVMADIARKTGDRAEAVADYATVANQGSGEAVTLLAEVL